MFKVILAATDGSGPGTRAAEAAADIAGKSGARLVLLSVVQPGALPQEITDEARRQEAASAHPLLANVPSWFDEARDQVSRDTGETHALVHALSREALDHGAALAKKHGVADCETVLEQGDPASAILACADRENADLIVLGRRGLGGIRQLLMGSVTGKVMQASGCCCLTVR